MLQPVGAAVEKAGGLPQLDIRLDNSGLDRKPSIEEKPHPQGESHDATSDDSDTLLELFSDDEDGEQDLLQPSDSPNQSEDKPIGSDTFDSKFEQLKKELMCGSKHQNGQPDGNGDVVASEGVGPVYENTKSSDSRFYQNVIQSHGDDDMLSHAPMFDGYQPQEGEEREFDLKENQCYGSTGEAPPTSAAAASDVDSRERDGNLYQDADAVVRFLEEEARREQGEGQGEGPNGAPSNDDHHDYEEMYSVFADSAKQEGVYCDIPDGGMLSRQEIPPAPEQLELEEIVPFKNLPPLVCTARLGDEVAMRKLADTAAAVLSEVVKHIHTSLGM